MNTTLRETLRPIVRGVYDQQKLRIQTGNRIVANFKAKLGQEPGATEEDSLSDDAQALLAKLRQEYTLIGTAIAEFKKTKGEPRPFAGGELIDNEIELALVEQYMDLEAQERRTFRRLEHVLVGIPMWESFLKPMRGVGPAGAAIILSEFDIARAPRVSNLWSYAGLDVASDGKGRSRKSEHLVTRSYTDKDGKPAERQGITFNPWLKTKLIGVIGPCLLKARNEKYSKVYYDYRARLEHHEIYKDHSKGHRHNMAMRYMVKMFLLDLYVAWRTIEGLPVSTSYHEGKLGRRHAA